jgi:hypothetical protein
VAQLVEHNLAKVGVAGSNPVSRSVASAGQVAGVFIFRGSAMADVVYVVTAWDERTNEDTVAVYSDKAKADAAWEKLDGPSVYGGVARRTVKK